MCQEARMSITGVIRAWWNYRGTHVITCPETHRPVAVRVGALQSSEKTRLKACTRWPEKKDCDQACVPELEAAPHATLVQVIAADWYVGKSCVFCKEPIGKIVWHDRPPALLGVDGTTREWKDIVPQDLPLVLATNRPVCWKCHVTQSFVHEHADWVVNRTKPLQPHKALEPSTSVY